MKGKETYLFHLKGAVCLTLIPALIESLSSSIMSMAAYKKPMQKRLLFVVVEILQNVYHHALDGTLEGALEVSEAESKELLLPLEFSISDKEKSNCAVMIQHPVGHNRAKELSYYIDKINSLSKEEKRSEYRDKLFFDSLSEKGGAGLGLLQMGMKSEEPIDYQVSFEEEKAIFRMEVNVSLY